MLSVNFYSNSVFLRFAFCASSQDEGSIFLNFGNIAFMEFIVRADFDDFEAFLDEERREVPKLFKAPVAVEDGADILCGVVSGDTKIVCHCVFLLCGKFLDSAVGVRQPNLVDMVQDILARLVVMLTVALQNFVVAERVFERHERSIRLFLCADKEDERFFTDKTLVIVHTSNAVM